jgi:hypothetical protein
MGAHWIVMPTPARTDPRLTSFVSALRGEAARASGRALAVHVLYSECRCSQRVLDHLLVSERPAEYSELVLFVGRLGRMAEHARARGFGVQSIGRRELEARLGVVAVPLLIVADSSGRIRYSGGYTDRKQGPRIEDLSIMGALLGGRDAAELPLYGCATSEALARRLDPIGVRRIASDPAAGSD